MQITLKGGFFPVCRKLGVGRDQFPNNFENNGAASHALSKLIVFYCFKNNRLPISSCILLPWFPLQDELHCIGKGCSEESDDSLSCSGKWRLMATLTNLQSCYNYFHFLDLV